MEAIRPAPLTDRASILAVGFGTTVAMWAVGYVGRLPMVLLPSPLILTLLLACMFAGGLALGRYSGQGWRHGAAAGLLSAVVNLLVLGSLLSVEHASGVPGPAIWLPGFFVLAALLGGFGAAVGERWLRREQAFVEWPAAFVRVGIAAALLLLAVGGLVTSTETGLAVVDWPNTFGYNMFLYPFSRMTGGVYYEHAHRLFGALVGLTVLVLAGLLQLREERAWVRRMAWVLFAVVVLQGILGGLRVTGTLTLSDDVARMTPSLALAMTHGVLAQLFFAGLVALGAFTSPTWRGATEPRARDGVSGDRVLSALLVGLMVVQLVLGAAFRHFGGLMLVHVTVGVALVAPLAVHTGFRAWGLNSGIPILERLGLGLVLATGLQIALGLAALVGRLAGDGNAPGGPLDIALTTAHQWFGAILLALAVCVACWIRRLLTPARADAPAA